MGDAAETSAVSEDNDEKIDTLAPSTKAATKKPPLESAEAIWTRSLVILSFWAVVVFLGLPLWWWTTSIHRARLPLDKMLEWADGKVRERNALLNLASAD